MANSFRSRLNSGDTLIGTIVTLTSPAVAEMLVDAGFDWLFVDGEHGPFETGDVMHMLQVVGDKAATVVRVPACEEVYIKRTLDLGADGIILPQVNTAAQAADVVRFSKYAPEGSRGVGLARAQGYGMRFEEYMQTANENIAVIVQAEHVDAVNNIEQIVEVPGIDAVLIGPYDLSASLGVSGQIESQPVTEAIEHVTKTCQAAGIRLGIFGVSAAAVRPYLDRGYTLIIAGVDTLMLGQSARAMLAELGR